ncbi:unnamed protein product [Clonostachys rhizophaga]|uniref:Uncharacterized protein n=1 Tax=Clonostachys rhizophaga TaxID=160324 RepID=A0A9N9YN16_9HYPO|nr:unnamed protein product [Clonostachys rhizophaga]
MRYRKAQARGASSPKPLSSDESGLIRGAKHRRNASLSSIYGGLFSRALPENVLCSGVDDSDDEVESQRRSLAIDKYLDTEREERKRRLNIIAIGSCEQKRILWKQMRLRVHPLRLDEQGPLCADVKKTVLDVAIRCLKVALDELEGSEASDIRLNEDAIASIRELLHEIDSFMEYDEAAAAELVLQIARGSKFNDQLDAHRISFPAVQRLVLDDKCPSFLACICTDDHDIMEVLERVFSPGYRATEHDWFHFEKPYHGVFVREIQIEEGDKILNFIDLYNRAERKRWVHVFEDLAALVFVADPSRYDVALEDECRPLDESLLLFDSIINSNWLRHTPVVLVLSNLAAFWKKLEIRPLSEVYGQYKGINDQAALDFITEKFKSLNRTGKQVRIYHSRGVGVDNQYGFLDLLEGAIGT